MATIPGDKFPLRGALTSIRWHYFLFGIVFGYWAVLIPTIKRQHDLTNSLVGLVLLTSVVGAIVGAPLVTAFIKRFGSRMALFSGSMIICCAVSLIPIGGPLWSLFLSLSLVGFGFSWNDIGATNQAIMFEAHSNREIIGLCYMTTSLGGLCGSLSAGGIATSDLSLQMKFSLLSLSTIIPTLASYFFLLPTSYEAILSSESKQELSNPRENTNSFHSNGISQEASPTPFLATQHNESFESFETNTPVEPEKYRKSADIERITASRAYIWGLIAIGFTGFLTNGSSTDWSAIYLRDTLGASPIISSLGNASFVASVMIGRYFMDQLVIWIPRYRLLQWSGILIFIGLGIVSSAASCPKNFGIAVAVFGYFVTGAGAGVLPPIVVSIAGFSINNQQTSDVVGFVQMFTYLGVLIGPPLVGFLSDGIGGLQYAFLVLGTWSLIVPAIATYYGTSYDYRKSFMSYK